MVAINLENFGGMIPITDERLLPNPNAAFAENTWVYPGTLRGFHEPVPVYNLINPDTKKVYRLPRSFFDKEHIPDSDWMEFLNPDTDVIRSPTLGDQYERFYWAQDQIFAPVPPMYNTKARILNGDPPYVLGIPTPAVAPGVTHAGGTVPVEDRVYVYTWQSTYGEEGPPSPSTTLAGKNADGTWTVTMTAPTAADKLNRSLAFTNIYRAISTTTGTATFYFVAQVPITTLSYADNLSSVVVSQARVLLSTTWTPPPANLAGWVAMPNGMVAGWRGSEVWFCEPYRMHAWPDVYTAITEYPIIGLGVIGQSVIACTTGNPYAISGVDPKSMATSRLAHYEPCLSRGSIVSTPIGVAYASSNGLAVAVPGEVSIATRNMIGKDDWAALLDLPTLRAAPLNGGYYTWGSMRGGVFEKTAFENTVFQMNDFTGGYYGAFLDLNNERVAYHELRNRSYPTENVIVDHWTGEVFLLRNRQVVWVDIAPKRAREVYKWRSKKFNLMERKNLAAMRIWFDLDPGLPVPQGERDTSLTQVLDADKWGIIRVYADDRLCYANELRKTGEIMRLPSDFKAQYYQFEIDALAEVSKIEVASTVKELISV